MRSNRRPFQFNQAIAPRDGNLGSPFKTQIRSRTE